MADLNERLKVVSGGQTGVDRAALDAAYVAGLSIGGWCPSGRLAEDGTIASDYPLTETPTAESGQRTQWNVRDADATLIISRQSDLYGGTLLTASTARRLSRPFVVADPEDTSATASVLGWLQLLDVETLNVAGPRESEDPGIYRCAHSWLRQLFAGFPLDWLRAKSG